ncbi:bifunctional metallophosphatase/5'-nucleotidase [Peribacillus saganii]|uniref:Bifunctional metallophosphatase/5'-nucleotidase n=1 Tax=Peribacillus saganii TaxID=2303992 RepID=A0A372LMS7_9BACI|nr:5'-nucleotidase C-terminal domain-containing protein [Peribacillus saganii]RFU68322.1 bifunctional metallophosphatase/5'-nucleotidase [Peribacillus saganii]
MAYLSKVSRKFIATAATAAITASIAVPAASAAAKFTDVPPHYQDAVDFLVSKGANGYTTTFGTHQTIKRVDAAVLLANVLGLDTKNAPASGFKDVPARAQGAVNALKAAGIISGKTATAFGTNSPVTRGELAIWLQKGFKLEGSAEHAFTDVNARYDAAVKAMVANNITNGVNKTKFGVNQPAKRGDFAIFLYKASLAQKDEDFKLSIMHTNDTHSHTEKIAKRATAIKEVRSQKPDALLLDAGDVFSGTLYFNEFQGQQDLEFMNYLGYDAMTFGNHEFDLGSSSDGHKGLADFVKKAEFPFVSANVDFSKDSLFNGLYQGTISSSPKDGNIYNGIVKEVDGEKIGIFGLTTEETPTISSTGKIEFSNYLEQAENAVDAFEKQGINKIIALTHLGYDDSIAFDNDLELAKKVEGIDVIVGGHTHTVLKAPTVVEAGNESTVIVQTGEYSNSLGTLDVEFDENGKVIGHAGELIDITKKADDPAVLEMLKPYSDKIAALQSQSIGVEAKAVLDGVRENVRAKETNLGNLITDGMLAKAKTVNPDTVIAVTNGGGIRASIEAGDITLGEILTTMPFGNTLGIMNLKGSEVKAALEHSVSQAPAASGGFLQVSGLTFTYDSSKPAGQRVLEVKVKGADGSFAPINDETSYFVATNTFTAKGGDGYEVFKKAYEEGRVSEPGYVDYEMFRDYLKTQTTVDPKVEGRIIDVAAAAPVTVTGN